MQANIIEGKNFFILYYSKTKQNYNMQKIQLPARLNLPIENKYIEKMLEHELYKSNQQSGQSLVEFMLLLASILIISMSFMKIVNKNVASYWTDMANTLMLDVEGNEKLNLR
jgi:hypothetical protein